MKPVFRYLGLSLLSVSLLASCNRGVDKGGEDDETRKGTEAVEHYTYEGIQTAENAPAPECLPFEAPRDYERVSPADANPYDAFFFISHKRANSVYVLFSRSRTEAISGTAFTFIQDSAGVTMNNGSTYFNVFASTGDVVGVPIPGLKGIANKAARGLEDIRKGIYLGQETTSGDNSSITVDYESEDWDTYCAQIEGWGGRQEVTTRPEFFDRFSKDLFAPTSYYVPDVSAIANAQKSPASDGNYTFTWTFSLQDGENQTDAAKFYRNALNEGIAGGAVSFDILSLTLNITVNSDWEILYADSVETYTVRANALGIQANATNNSHWEVTYYDSAEDISNQSAINEWNDAVNSLDAQESVGLLGL